MAAYMDEIVIGLSLAVITVFVIRFAAGWFQYTKSIQQVIYSGYTEFLMKKRTLRRLSESIVFKQEFNNHKILYQLYDPNNGKGQLQPYLIIILSSGLYCLKVLSTHGEVYGKQEGEWKHKVILSKGKSHTVSMEMIPNPTEEIEQFSKKVRDKITKIQYPVYKILVFPDQCSLKLHQEDMGSTKIIKRSMLLKTLKKLHASGKTELEDWEIEAAWDMAAKESLELEYQKVTGQEENAG